jgi:hypothetical protein
MKAQLFRKRKKEYIEFLENRVKELEQEVVNLSSKLEFYKSSYMQSMNEFDLSLPKFKFDSGWDIFSPESINSIINAREKLMFLFNKLEIGEHPQVFRYLDKMSMWRKSELLKSEKYNSLEWFMFESNMSRDEWKEIFHTQELSNIRLEFKR